MKVLVCGGREFDDYARLQIELDAMHKDAAVSLLIHGGALGADRLAARWAFSRAIPAMSFPANWEKHGKAAGPMRNQQMLEQRPDIVVAFPGGKGTADMARRARNAGVPVREIVAATLSVKPEGLRA